MKPKTSLDIRIQRFLATSLIPLSPALLIFFLYRSRGAYRLSGQTLSAPGHPPVNFDQILEMDMSLWARKGIAHVKYRLSDAGKTSTLTLDDFIYEQEATDQIVARIEKFIALASARAAGEGGGEEGGRGTDAGAEQA